MNQEQQKEQQKKYADYVKEVTPTHSLPLNMAKAFLTGGLICVLGQIITNFAKSQGLDQEMAGTWCSITLVFISVILTGFNLYPKIGKFGAAEVWFPSPDLPTPWQHLPLNTKPRDRFSESAARSSPLQGRLSSTES